jgi:hypothetical protein
VGGWEVGERGQKTGSPHRSDARSSALDRTDN